MMRKKRSDMWNPDPSIVADIIGQYNQGLSARKLGFQYGVADVTITGLLRKNNVFIRNRSNARRTNQINETIFDNIETEEQFYWFGFILADGNIYYPPKRSKQLNFGLKESDWEHLEKFKKFIGSNKSLYYNKGGVFISFYSNQIVDALEKYGITPRKSLTAKVPEFCKNNRHFWRGVVDGDGWVGRFMLGICGTHDIVISFKQFVNDLAISIGIGVPDVVVTKKTNFCYECRYQGRYVAELFSIIYEPGDVCLDRKNMGIVGV